MDSGPQVLNHVIFGNEHIFKALFIVTTVRKIQHTFRSRLLLVFLINQFRKVLKVTQMPEKGASFLGKVQKNHQNGKIEILLYNNIC